MLVAPSPLCEFLIRKVESVRAIAVLSRTPERDPVDRNRELLNGPKSAVCQVAPNDRGGNGRERTELWDRRRT
jgi:hypothetical protein